MKTIHPLILFCVASLIALGTPEARATHNVVNGGFETGNFAGWTVVDSSNFTNVGGDPAFAHSGQYHANLGATGTIGSLSQSILPMAGVRYQLSFWLANDATTGPNSFQAILNGVTLLSLTNSPAFGYTNFIFAFVGTGAPMLLDFRYRNDPDFWRLDDVNVTTPDSGATALLALPAFAAILLLHSRRAQKGSLS